MSVSSVVTGDAVVLDLRPARVPTRVLSAGIDITLVALASLAWSWVVDAVADGSPALVDAVTIAGSIVILFGYPIAMETVTRGRTVGAYALGLQATRDDGGAIRFRQALLRGLSFWLIDVAPWTGFCGGLICAALNPDGKRIGDLLAGTIVVRVRAPRSVPPITDVPPELASWAATAELSRVPDELITAARQVVQRNAGLLPLPRKQLTDELARQVAERTAPAPPADTEALIFLTAVVAERRRREHERIAARQWVPSAAELPQGWR